MWELHITLADSVADNPLLIDEVSSMIDKITSANFFKSLNILYKKYDIHKWTPVENLTHFVSGLKHNKFFEFDKFIKAIHGNS